MTALRCRPPHSSSTAIMLVFAARPDAIVLLFFLLAVTLEEALVSCPSARKPRRGSKAPSLLRGHPILFLPHSKTQATIVRTHGGLGHSPRRIFRWTTRHGGAVWPGRFALSSFSPLSSSVFGLLFVNSSPFSCNLDFSPVEQSMCVWGGREQKKSVWRVACSYASSPVSWPAQPSPARPNCRHGHRR